MIQANYVHISKESSQAVYIEAEASFTEGIPIVHRVAPKLSVFAEIVWRHPSNKSRTVLFVEQEQFGMGPYVARIGRNIERKVTDQSNSSRVCILFETLCLFEDQELGKANLIHLLRQILASLGHSRGSAANEFCRPFKIRDAMELLFQDPKERIVFQPMCLPMAKHLVTRTQVSPRTRTEIAPYLVEQSVLELNHRSVIHRVRREKDSPSHAFASSKPSSSKSSGLISNPLPAKEERA